MNREDAEEFTAALGQVWAGGYRLSLQAWKLGVPQALDMTHEEWVTTHLGGYVRLGVSERREAVAELTEAGMTTPEIADVLGIGERTVTRDRSASPNGGADDDDQAESDDQPPPNGAHPLADQATRDIEAAGAEPDDVQAAAAEAVVEERLREQREVAPIVTRIFRASLDGAQRVRAYGVHSTVPEAEEYIAQLTKARAAIDELLAAWIEALNEARLTERR